MNTFGEAAGTLKKHLQLSLPALSQNARQNALGNFKSGKIRVLVATDIAARGIDIDDLSHVINFELPDVPETYVHRIGRTGRAGNSGVAFSFCGSDERDALKDIQKLIGKTIPVVNEHPFLSDTPFTATPARAPQKPAQPKAVNGNLGKNQHFKFRRKKDKIPNSHIAVHK